MAVRPALFFGMTGLLLVSILLNTALLFRTRTEPVPSRPASSSILSARRASEPVPASGGPSERAMEARFVATSPAAPLEAAPARAASPATASPAGSLLQDPKIAGIIEAQDRFAAFRKDLDKVVKVRGKIEEPLYLDSVMRATVEFLEIPAALRGRFSETAVSAADAWARAKRERDDARQGLPPKDKANPAYQQQKDAIDARYDEGVKAATEMLKAQLDLTRPSHVEFAGKADNWLKNIAPRTGP